MSRHHLAVATSVARNSGRDVIQLSLHQLQGKKVTTSFSCRDISYKERRSRHHLAVATSVARNSGRDVIQLSRHQLQGKKVATSFSGRDIRSKGC